MPLRSLFLLATLALVAAALVGCASVPSAGPGGGATPGAPAAPAPSLRTEHRWLTQWFRDTPVQIVLQRDDVLTVEVPMDFCFDDGRVAVKPPLAAVLDRVATSLRRQDQARVHVAAAGDAKGPATLATRRATAVRTYLVGRGVQPHRFASLGPADRDAVRLRLELPPLQ